MVKQPKDKTFVKTNNLVVKLIYPDKFAQNLNKRYGLYSPIQKFIDEYVRKGIVPYLPYKEEGSFVDSMHRTEIGSGKIIFDPVSPEGYHYGARLYFNPEFKFTRTVHHLAGAFWDKRWLANNKVRFISAVQAFDKR